MIFEFRTYTAAPGKIFALHQRFGDGTIDLFRAHGFDIAGFWMPTVGRIFDQIHYLLRWESHEQMEAGWAAFLADPAWQKLAADSEVDGPLIARVDTELWAEPPYFTQS